MTELMIKATRGNEWLVIEQLNENEALWLYGEGVTGNGRSVCPLNVLESQLKAHEEHGWKVTHRDI